MLVNFVVRHEFSDWKVTHKLPNGRKLRWGAGGTERKRDRHTDRQRNYSTSNIKKTIWKPPEEIRQEIYEKKQSNWCWTSPQSEGSLEEKRIMPSKYQGKNITANSESYT